MNPISALRKYGLTGSVALGMQALDRPRVSYWKRRHRDAPQYRSPTPDELQVIEGDLATLGVEVLPLRVDPAGFRDFCARFPFPTDYFGGPQSAVWNEKMLEHFLAYEHVIRRLGPDDLYVDIASNNSPWACLLRERDSRRAYALDLQIQHQYRSLDYYLTEDATATRFADGSVAGASLQCAFEMFIGDADVRAVREWGRVLAPGGRVIISPLYMHTHYCCYATAEYWGRGFGDAQAKEYIRLDCRGVPSSRKYDAQRLKSRILDTADSAGLRARLYALRNGGEIGPNIYCHFVLVLEK